MNIDTLIDRLADDLTPVRRRRSGVDMLIVAALAAVELALLFAVGMAHLDMHKMMTEPTVGWRLASLGLISVVSGVLAIRSFDPSYSPKGGLRWLALLVAVCLAFGLILGAVPDGLASLVRRIDWTQGVRCATTMAVLSIPPLIALVVLGRRGAPTDLRRTPLLVGFAAAAWGAFAFVFACPINDPLFIVFWYSVGCALVIVPARLILPRLARW